MTNNHRSSFFIWFHFRGNDENLVSKRVFLVYQHPDEAFFCGYLYDRGADVYISFSMTTYLFRDKMLDANPEWLVLPAERVVGLPMWRRVLIGNEIVWQNDRGDLSYVPWLEDDGLVVV